MGLKERSRSLRVLLAELVQRRKSFGTRARWKMAPTQNNVPKEAAAGYPGAVYDPEVAGVSSD